MVSSISPPRSEVSSGRVDDRESTGGWMDFVFLREGEGHEIVT
jgi:hypothetical protein